MRSKEAMAIESSGSQTKRSHQESQSWNRLYVAAHGNDVIHHTERENHNEDCMPFESVECAPSGCYGFVLGPAEMQRARYDMGHGNCGSGSEATVMAMAMAMANGVEHCPERATRNGNSPSIQVNLVISNRPAEP
ncbi:uncharacterized protein MYCFIDRAFT_169720 [Pseudocercospora fijiensis CIRAD86]|uniref:Uncharacterized protein n=1 Tax=Pseudocercospora fijiensis (strain CIRAD86) TaxID=383855 RepID=N1QAK7_PSEFD|nr:uncharacterized protein MYCFIDRAFT_169720 [Pseudocercospora fijiensis CIRAD86]EME88002.1 hypothetical protein MYCFIDRAFT_169720 [Pseudocercospora fijiensis CIRAD86]